MDTFYVKLIEYGGAAAILGAAAYLIREVGRIWARRNNGNLEEIVDRTVQNIEANHLHEVPEIIRSLGRIEEKLDRQFEKVNEKLDKLNAIS